MVSIWKRNQRLESTHCQVHCITFQKQSSGSGYDSLTFGTNILSSTQNKYAVSGTANLTINNVASSDEGLYQCSIGSTTREISFTPVGRHSLQISKCILLKTIIKLLILYILIVFCISTLKSLSFHSLVLPNNVSVYWENPPYAGRVVNITCKATYANPPPYLKWFKGVNQMELTQNAYYYTTNVRSSGKTTTCIN